MPYDRDRDPQIDDKPLPPRERACEVHPFNHVPENEVCWFCENESLCPVCHLFSVKDGQERNKFGHHPDCGVKEVNHHVY